MATRVPLVQSFLLGCPAFLVLPIQSAVVADVVGWCARVGPSPASHVRGGVVSHVRRGSWGHETSFTRHIAAARPLPSCVSATSSN